MKPFNLDYSGEAVFLNYGLEEDYKGEDVKGKLIIVKAGSADNQDMNSAGMLTVQKGIIAKEKGVAGIIEMWQLEDEMWKYVELYVNQDRLEYSPVKMEGDVIKMPYLMLWDKTGDYATDLSAQTDITASLKIEGIKKRGKPS